MTYNQPHTHSPNQRSHHRQRIIGVLHRSPISDPISKGAASYQFTLQPILCNSVTVACHPVLLNLPSHLGTQSLLCIYIMYISSYM